MSTGLAVGDGLGAGFGERLGVGVGDAGDGDAMGELTGDGDVLGEGVSDDAGVEDGLTTAALDEPRLGLSAPAGRQGGARARP